MFITATENNNQKAENVNTAKRRLCCLNMSTHNVRAFCMKRGAASAIAVAGFIPKKPNKRIFTIFVVPETYYLRMISSVSSYFPLSKLKLCFRNS